MGNRKWIWLPVSAVTILLLTGCGGDPTNVTNPPPPVTQSVAIEFQPSPPAAINISTTASLIAVVKNDPSNAGVDWSLKCPAGVLTCGSLSSAHTVSGKAQVYTPPSALPSNSQSVTIGAFATADHTKNVVTAINVGAFGSVLKGSYVVETSGSDIYLNPYQRAGVIVLDGNGGITGGEQTVNFVNPNTSVFSSVADPVTGGSYFIGANGRGTLTINTNDLNIGQQGIETFSLVVLSSSHALITKLDNLNLTVTSGETSVGTLDLQNSQARAIVPAKGYAFVTDGTDMNALGMALGGVFNIDSSQTISGAGSAVDQASLDLGAGIVAYSTAISGTVSTPDSFGMFQVDLQVTQSSNLVNVQLTAYPLGDGTHLKVIESDGVTGLTVGDAFSQGLATGTFTTQSTFTGNYVFEIFGRDLDGSAASLAAAGLFSTTGAGSLTNGYLDESQFSIPLQISDGFSAVYAVGPGSNPAITTDPAGIGRFYIPVSSTGANNFTFSTNANGTGPAWVFYLTGNNGPALMLDADDEPTFDSEMLPGGGVGTGIAYPVVGGAPFSGSYGTIFAQDVGSEQDAVGEIAAKGSALTGVVDINSASGPLAIDDTSLSGSYQNSAISNRQRGVLTADFFLNIQGTTSLSMAFYPIDSSQGFFVENDLADSMGNLISGDLTLGYYTARTPVCLGCP